MKTKTQLQLILENETLRELNAISYDANARLSKENEALLAKNKELEEELKERKAYIVANPCAQCGGRINAMKCEAWAKKAKELEEKLKNTPDQPELGFNSPTWSDVSKPEPKWLPMSYAPKCGSPITVKQSTNKRHKIFKANWFLNKWYSLYEEGNNEEVYPEFWLEGSKEEPKIDMKKECVEPVSIWKDVSELPEGMQGQILVAMKDGTKGLTYYTSSTGDFSIFLKHKYGNTFDDISVVKQNIERWAYLTDFVNQVEDMEARLRKLEGK
jgi:ssDNA-binding Zn-finger/Zn-ribbon topoisomerase 1